MEQIPPPRDMMVMAYAFVFILYFLPALMSWLLYQMPPKEINSFFSYRTSRAMKNQANWDFANKLAGKVMLYGIYFFLLISLLFVYFAGPHLPFLAIILVTAFTLVGCLFTLVQIVENKLARFEQGNTANQDAEAETGFNKPMDADKAKLLRLAAYGMLFVTWFFIGGLNLATYLSPPKKINPVVGYRTETSMKNQANWDYANKVSSEVMLYSINFYLISSLLLLYFLRSRPSPILSLGIVSFNLMLCIGVGIVISEKKLAQFEQQTIQESSPAK